jgi:tetratricopeptide (TPR) repeat protein
MLLVLLSLTLNSCKKIDVNDQFQKIEKSLLKPSGISMDYPKEGTLFPPEFPCPSFFWRDTVNAFKEWHIRLSTQNGEEIYQGVTESPSWRPDPKVWSRIKEKSATKPVFLTVIGIKNGILGSKSSSGRTSFSFSSDSVGASVFYRAVPLPFSYAVAHVNEIEWHLCSIEDKKSHKVLDNMPVCANCHSFSKSGLLAMDVDYANDKGSYIIAPVKDTVHMTFDKIITWSDYKRDEGGITYGLLSQVSPDGQYVLSTVKDRSVFVPVDNLEYSQLFFPIKGIIAVYNRNTKKYTELNGASNKQCVQSNPNWSPDGQEVMFARTNRYQSSKIENSESVILKTEDASEFVSGKQEFKFDLYRVPFNKGAGGQAVPVAGASNNKKSNYFARYSPDGKWIVFCQASNFMLLQRDSKLYIMPAKGGTPRLMKCNTGNMNSWHSWSPNSRWLVFSSKGRGPYTQLYLTHIDENGNDSPPVYLENMAFKSRAANIPEFFDNKNNLKKLVDNFSKNAVYYTRLAELSVNENKYKDALKHLDDAIKQDSSYYNAYKERIYINFILGRSKSKDDLRDIKIAKRLIDQKIKKNPGDQSLYEMRGNLRLMLEDYEGALQDGMHALKLNPSDYSGYELVASVYQKTGQTDKAIVYQKKMLEKQPDNIYLLDNLSLLYRNRRQLDQSLEIINKVINRLPGNSGAYTSRAQVMLLKGDLPSAKADYEKAISVEPENYLCYQARGYFYMQTSASDLAKKDFNKAISLLGEEITKNPQNANLLTARAEILELLGDKAGLLNACENYLKAWPLNSFVMKKALEAYLEQNRVQSAMNICNSIIDNFPEDPTGYIARGMINQQQNYLPQALNDMNHAIQIDPSNYLYYLQRSAVEYQLGYKADSKKDLKICALKLNELKKKRKLTGQEQETLSKIESQV